MNVPGEEPADANRQNTPPAHSYRRPPSRSSLGSRPSFCAVDLWYHTPVRQATLLGELISADPALVTAGWRGTKAPLTAMTAAM